MAKNKISEVELAKYFIKYFELLGYKIYKEVDTPYGTCDIIAIKENEIICVETKTTFNFSVLEQSINNKNISNYSYIAVPWAKNRKFQRKLAKDYNVGILELNMKNMNIVETATPICNEKIKRKISLHEFHTLNEAGTKGKRMTSFKDYILSVKELLRNGEKTYKEIYENTRKHYSNVNSFKSTIRRYIDSNVEITHGILYNKTGLYLKK